MTLGRLIAVAAVAAAAACGAPAGAPPDGGTETAADMSAPADLTHADGCTDPESKWPDGGTCVVAVAGRIVDEKGQPIAGRVVTTCGSTCFFGKSASDGSFTVHVGSHIPVAEFAVDVHGSPDLASYYTPLLALAGDSIAFPSPLVVPTLPTSGPLLPMDGSAAILTSGDVTVTLADGTKVSLPIDDVGIGDAGMMLRALTVADPSKLPFIDGANPPLALYGLGPFEVVFSQPVALAFANTTQLLPGAAVDVYLMRGLALAGPPAGRFDLAASAHVTSDGKSIATDPGQGVLTLTWIALRAH